MAAETRCLVKSYVPAGSHCPDLSGTGFGDGQGVSGVGRDLRMEREGNADRGAGIECLDVEQASELENALAHAGDANPGLSR